jgi:selenocysteine lyase/cysteine desulfurase
MVDDAIEEMAAWMRSGHTANHGGAFQAAERTDALVDEARASVARLLGAGPEGVVFGPSMTALTMRFAAAACRALQPATRSSSPAWTTTPNVAPWLIAADRAGVEVRFAEPERETSSCPPRRSKRCCRRARAGWR